MSVVGDGACCRGGRHYAVIRKLHRARAGRVPMLPKFNGPCGSVRVSQFFDMDGEMNPADVAQSAVAPVGASGVSFIELFLHASLTVQIIMTGLGIASVWSWAIIFEKLLAFRRARIESDRFEQLFWSGQSLDELYANLSRGRTITMAALFVAAMREWKRSVEGNIRALGGIQLRVEKVMDVTISREMERLDRRLLFLATVGSTAPFVGLFGTVWGIMTSFQSIAVSKNTSLAVVAPGIAEALFATALGLMAAIPAVIFYNKFSADSAAISQRLYAFSDEFAAIVSRQIDVRA
ncbi:Cell division and transport-associated protein TolQ [Hyphomicrobium facile]|uniref:Tol-Pal system protein TolQ n=2 Tax=Hyphomicrobium facile TaxID=51670 RepID=A0A1I7MZQ1_9HYPH|nr:Cell division and transport-associated protein TolQ [Hyphomicrobium facile]